MKVPNSFFVPIFSSGATNFSFPMAARGALLWPFQAFLPLSLTPRCTAPLIFACKGWTVSSLPFPTLSNLFPAATEISVGPYATDT